VSTHFWDFQSGVFVSAYMLIFNDILNVNRGDSMSSYTDAFLNDVHVFNYFQRLPLKHQHLFGPGGRAVGRADFFLEL